MISLKPGVCVTGLRPEILLGLLIADTLWGEYATPLVITSALDGVHIRGSEHKAGAAVDLRTHTLPRYVKKTELIRTLQDRLGPDFDVLLEGEGTPNEHCHLEFDPK